MLYLGKKVCVMTVIGLTGPTGAGKGEVANILKTSFGAMIINADEVYHSLLVPPSECLDEICKEFGSSVLLENGTLNRQALANVVFSNEDKLQRLNTVTHKYVLAEIVLLLNAKEYTECSITVIDAPLLIEAGVDKICKYTVSVLADKDIRTKRIQERDKITLHDAEKRISAQQDDSFYISNSDFIIYNNSDTSGLVQQIGKILETIGGGR